MSILQNAHVGMSFAVNHPAHAKRLFFLNRRSFFSKSLKIIKIQNILRNNQSSWYEVNITEAINIFFIC